MWQFLLGAVMLVYAVVSHKRSPKGRMENGDFAESLKWSYIWFGLGGFMLVGSIFGQMAAFFAVFVATGVLYAIHKWRGRRHARGADPLALPEYAAGFFPLVAVIFLVRAFLFEPFVIPSSSMRPVLEVGDVVVVKKYSNGIRNPLTNNVWWPTDDLHRGDVIVFKYPEYPLSNYIKRVVGLAGDVVEYNRSKQLLINGRLVSDVLKGSDAYIETGRGREERLDVQRYSQTLEAHTFDTYKMPERPSVVLASVRKRLMASGACSYAADGSSFKCTVPQGHYFVMGDNRDNSSDSRYWGFVPYANVVGVTERIVLNVPKLARMWRNVN